MQRTNLRSEKKSVKTHRSETRTDSNGNPIGNQILISIPEHEYNLIRSDLEYIQTPQQHILHEAGEKIEFAYFLNEGMASLVVLTTDGRSVEVAIVGCEGIVGTPLAVGMHRGPYRSIMQIPGSGVRIRSELLEERCPRCLNCGCCSIAMFLYKDCKSRRSPPATGCTKSNNVWPAGC